VSKKPLRRLLVRTLLSVSPEAALWFDRKLRGFAEARKLARADAVVVSHPKSGRTWLRAMLSWYWCESRHLPVRRVLGFWEGPRLHPSIPRVLFTHDHYPVFWLGEERLLALYAEKPVVLLVRHPCDVTVSAFHQTRHRTDPLKKHLYGKDAPELADLSAFFRHPAWGLARPVAFLERWAAWIGRLPRALVVRYEDLRRDPAGGLVGILRHLGEEPDPAHVARAVAETEFSRMQARERAGLLADGSARFSRGSDPAALKVREGRVGGWREKLSSEDVAFAEALLRARLPRGFGYRPDEREMSAKAARSGAPSGSG